MLRSQLRSPTPARAPVALAAPPAAPQVAAAAPPAREKIAGALAGAALGALALVASPAGAIASDVAPPTPPTSSTSTPSTSSSSSSPSYSSTSPYLDLEGNISYGLTRDGRIRPCPGAVPNCVSTSSTTDLYSPALRAAATTPGRAARALDAAVAAGLGGEKTFESREEGSIFLQYEVPGASPRVRGPRGQPTRDVVEVLLRREKKSGSEENKSSENGDSDGDDVLVFYRSIADPASIRYVPLIQQPVTDGGAQRARMRALLVGRMGWRAIGCDVLDCFF